MPAPNRTAHRTARTPQACRYVHLPAYRRGTPCRCCLCARHTQMVFGGGGRRSRRSEIPVPVMAAVNRDKTRKGQQVVLLVQVGFFWGGRAVRVHGGLRVRVWGGGSSVRGRGLVQQQERGRTWQCDVL